MHVKMEKAEVLKVRDGFSGALGFIGYRYSGCRRHVFILVEKGLTSEPLIWTLCSAGFLQIEIRSIPQLMAFFLEEGRGEEGVLSSTSYIRVAFVQNDDIRT